MSPTNSAEILNGNHHENDYYDDGHKKDIDHDDNDGTGSKSDDNNDDDSDCGNDIINEDVIAYDDADNECSHHLFITFYANKMVLIGIWPLELCNCTISMIRRAI